MGFSRLGQVNACLLLTRQGTIPEGTRGTVRNRKFTIVRDPQAVFHVPSTPPPPPYSLPQAFQFSPSNSSSVQPLLSRALPREHSVSSSPVCLCLFICPTRYRHLEVSFGERAVAGPSHVLSLWKSSGKDDLLEFKVLTATWKNYMRQLARRAAQVVSSWGSAGRHFWKTNIIKASISITPGV